MEILQSTAVQDALVEKLQLERVYRDHFIEDAREDLRAHTTVSRNKRSGIVTIVVTDRNDDRAIAMDRDYDAELNRIVVAMAVKSAQADCIYLQQQLARTTAELKTAESSAAAFSSGAMVLDTADQLQTALRRERQLEEAINRGEAELQALRTRYTDESPNVRIVKAQLSELKTNLSEFVGKQFPDASDRALASVDVTTTSLREIPFLAARYDDLNRVVESKERIAQSLNKKYQEALLKETSDVPLVAVLDEPAVSLVRMWPLYFGIIFVATCLSASLASAYAIIIHETSQKPSATSDGAAPTATPTTSSCDLSQTVTAAPE